MSSEIQEQVQRHLAASIEAIRLSTFETRLSETPKRDHEGWRDRTYKAWQRFECWKRSHPDQAAAADRLYSEKRDAWYDEQNELAAERRHG